MRKRLLGLLLVAALGLSAGQAQQRLPVTALEPVLSVRLPRDTQLMVTTNPTCNDDERTLRRCYDLVVGLREAVQDMEWQLRLAGFALAKEEPSLDPGGTPALFQLWDDGTTVLGLDFTERKAGTTLLLAFWIVR